jgi:hypothetical protein
MQKKRPMAKDDENEGINYAVKQCELYLTRDLTLSRSAHRYWMNKQSKLGWAIGNRKDAHARHCGISVEVEYLPRVSKRVNWKSRGGAIQRNGDNDSRRWMMDEPRAEDNSGRDNQMWFSHCPIFFHQVRPQ